MEFISHMKIVIVIHSNKMKFLWISLYTWGFSVLELSKFLMYETYNEKLQPYFVQQNVQLHYMDTDSFVLSVKTKDLIKDLKKLEDFFVFSNLDENHELFSNKNKKVID